VRGQGLVREPRELLRRMPRAEFVELPEADWCCGGAGSYALSHYELAMQVLDRKMENLRKTGADVLVTTCPACILQLSHGVRRHGLKAEVRHLTEVVSGPGG
jgi:glycolate oxidase iron-sulfur subunit